MIGLACGGEMPGLVDQPAGGHANHSHSSLSLTDSSRLLVAFFLAKYSLQILQKQFSFIFHSYLEPFILFLPNFTPVFLLVFALCFNFGFFIILFAFIRLFVSYSTL
jgi:hypothetical protein